MQRSAVTIILVSIAILSLAGVRKTLALPPLFRENEIFEKSSDSQIAQERDDLNYRLPNNTLPEHYDIVLTTKVDEGIREFQGIVTIDLIVVEPSTTSIVLNTRQLNVTSAKIQTGTAAQEDLAIDNVDVREFLTLSRQGSNSNIPFANGTKWKLTIAYDGLLRTDNGGFYMTSYTDSDGNTKYLAATQFESTNARHAFPCYDDPGKRASFTVTINHSPNYEALSNMQVAQSTSGKTVFQPTVNMPTYLVAFVISDFKYTEGVLNNLPQRVYSRPGTEHEQEWALVSGMLITERLAEYFNVSFMLNKLDQAAIPGKSGAMENWGLATYGEQYMLYNKDTSTINTQTNIANIIGHEICHQWFGNYVTIQWWTYLWLKEGFATLFSYKSPDAAFPEWGIWQQFHTDDYQSALNNDAGNSPTPMTHYVQTPGEISGRYDTVSYAKAGSVLNMWNHALTDKVFQRGLNIYLTENQYTSAVESQLFDAIQTAASEEKYSLPASIDDLMGSWSRQGGYPLLTVTRNYDDGSFTVTQQAFFNNASITQQKTWYIPFNYAIQSNPDFRNTEASHYLLNVPEIKVSGSISKDDWLILNKQSEGFYRINYDERNWELITNGLVNQIYKIHPRNRAQLMHDAYRFSASNRLKHSILLKLLTYLNNEDQFAPWSTANGIITTYNRYLSGDANYADFQQFVADLVAPIYAKLGVNDVPGEQHYQKYIRNIAINLACLAGIESCLQETNNKLKDLVEHNIAIEPNVQSQVYCNGLKQSGDDVFNFAYDNLMNSSDQALRNTLISSLGCAQKESQIQKFINSSIDTGNKLSSQERTTLLSAAYARGTVGLLESIEFLNNNWQAYADLSNANGSSNPLDIDIRGISSYVVNKEQEEKLLALVDKVKNSPKVSASLEATVRGNIATTNVWLESNRESLMSWFGDYVSDGNGSGNDGGNGDDGSASVMVSSIALAAAVFLTVSRLF